MSEVDSQLTIQIGNLLEMNVDQDSFEAVGKPSGPITRIIGLVSGLLFIGVASFLTFMLWNEAPLWMLVPLWLVLTLLGGWLIAGNLSAEKRVDLLRASAATGELSWGKKFKGLDEIKGTMWLTDIQDLNLGTDSTGDQIGVTALYVTGEGSPWNGALISGTVPELEEVRRHIKRLMVSRENS
ncbi:MAG: hypothetical protein ABJ327_25910 [Litoreibacter sp.]